MVLLLYGAVFYRTRRLLLTSALAVALAMVPYFRTGHIQGSEELTALLVQIGTWAAASLGVHRLVLEIRTHARQLDDQRQRDRSLFDGNPDGAFSRRAGSAHRGERGRWPPPRRRRR